MSPSRGNVRFTIKIYFIFFLVWFRFDKFSSLHLCCEAIQSISQAMNLNVLKQIWYENVFHDFGFFVFFLWRCESMPIATGVINSMLTICNRLGWFAELDWVGRQNKLIMLLAQTFLTTKWYVCVYPCSIGWQAASKIR